MLDNSIHQGNPLNIDVRNIVSVSYTHLDVYKRQIMYHSRFKGEHYQIGFKWGRNLLKHKQLFLTNVPFEITLEHYDFALQCLPIYQKFFPEIIEEIRGIADGQKRCV